MKKLGILFLLFFTLNSFAQTENNPAVFSTSVEKVSEETYDLIFTVKIQDQWHMYSQYNPENASLPMEILAAKNTTGFQLIGKAVESKTYKEYSDVWEKEEIYFKERAIITQRIQLTNTDISNVTLNFFAQVCKEVCIQIEEDFTFSLDGKAIVTAEVELDEKSKLLSNQLVLPLKNKDLLDQDLDGKQQKKDLFTIFLLGFIGGLLALLTPCVFPMIPLTVSFFTKKNGQNSRSGISKALLYGFFIFAVYVILSIPFHLLDSVNPDILNEISTNIWLNSLFFIVFVFFAFSFFGYY